VLQGAAKLAQTRAVQAALPVRAAAARVVRASITLRRV
jgi:hypothetical protein